MEERLRVLERRQRILMVMLAAAVVVGLTLGMTAPRVADELEVRRLVVVSPEGAPLIELDGTKHGGRLVVRTPERKDLVRLDADWRGGGVKTYRADGVPATSMHAYSVTRGKIAGMVETFDPNGRPAVSLGTGDSGPHAVSMGAACDGGVLVLSRDEMLHRIDACWLETLENRLPE